MTTIVWRVARRSLALASVRYRALLPALSLQPHGFRSLIVDKASPMPWPAADLVVFSKAFGAADLAAAREASERGVPVALDLCDNIFMPAYGANSQPRPADAFKSMAGHASIITCTTAPMAQVIRAQTGVDTKICVVPDSVETESLIYQQQQLLDTASPVTDSARSRLAAHVLGLRRWLTDSIRMLSQGAGTQAGASDEQIAAVLQGHSVKTILWFGNHGSEHGDHGLNDIVRFRPALERAATEHGARLLVVSNHRQRFEQLIVPLAIPSEYLEWSPNVLVQALAASDVTIVPNSLDAFSIGKSANRAVMSLRAGVPVVATPTSALQPLADAVWTGDPAAGLQVYLGSPDKAASDVRLGGELVNKYFSLEAVGRRWRDCFEPLLQ